MISRFWLLAFVVLLWVLQESPVSSQDPQTDDRSKRSVVPYQRVFLPLELLDQLSDELRSHKLLGRPEWEQLFNPFLVDEETAKIFSKPPEIAQIYLSARLDGSNLVSNSSRVRFTRGSITAESYRLEPWSLAINSTRPGESSLSSRIVRSGNDVGWGHDRNGTPVINLHRSTIENAIQPFDLNFPWTLRSLGTSKPTNLQFSFSLPRVSDSCLVLSLPKQATIIDADASITKVEDWSLQSKRLGEWGDQADLELNRVNLASDSRWLIELSGLDRCRFTISFDEGSDVGASASNSLDYLVLEHITDHELNRFAVTSSAKLEITGDRNQWDRPLKFQLPSTSRIRSLTVAGREVGWRSQDGMIVVQADDLRRIPTTRESTTTVKISYLTLLEDFVGIQGNSSVDGRENIEMGPIKVSFPHLQLEKSFVIKGLTNVKRSSDVHFSRIETTAKLKPLEKDLETSWEWSGYGPDFSVELVTSSSKREIRAITKVTLQGDEPKISLRLMLPSSPQLPIVLELPKSWEYLTIASTVNTQATAWSVVKDQQSNSNRFYLSGGPVESVSNLDLQVQHVAKESLAQLDFDGNWLLVDGKPVPNKLVVESLPSDWEVQGLRSSDIVAINQLNPEEKSFTTAGDTGLICLLKGYGLSLSKVPPRQTSRSSVSATLERVGESLIRAKYLLKMDGTSSVDSIRIKYDAEKANVVTLRVLDKQGAQIKSDVSWSYNESDHTYDVLSIEPNQTVLLTADLAFSDGRAMFPVPRILDAGASVLELKIDPTLTVEDRSLGQWSYGSDGELIVTVSNELEDIGVVANKLTDDVKSLTDESIAAHYDLTVDGQGSLRAFWGLRLTSMIQKDYRFTIDEGWDFELSEDAFSNGQFVAWIENRSGRSELRLRANPSFFLGSSARFEFTTKRNSSLVVPDSLQPLVVHVPRIYSESRERIKSDGALWFPKGAGWRVKGSTGRILAIAPFPIVESEMWNWRPWDVLMQVSDTKTDEVVDERKASDSLGDLSTSWISSDNFEFGWEKLLNISSDEEVTRIVLDDISRLRKWQTFSFCVGIFIGALVIRWSKIVLCFGILVLFSAVLFLQLSRFDSISVIVNSFLWGGLLGAIIWHIRMALNRDPLTPTRQSTHSTIWDVPKVGLSEGLNKVGLGILIFGLVFGLSSKVVAQESVAGGSAAIPSIFIPFDSKQEEKVDQVLVPEDLLKRVRGNPGTPYTLKSAKHQLKLSARGMTVEGVDQLVSTYEVYVNEPSSTIEIPFKPSLQNFSRLLVDGREVTVVPALASQREFVSWVSDREGLRTITVYQVPRWVSRPAATVGTVSLDSREIDLSVLPASNAILEVDSDPTVVLDVDSQGAVLDKESGRYVVYLGALPSIRGKVRYEPSTTASMATRSQSDLTFDIELLLQTKTVLARTVLRAGIGSSLDKRLTIEADKMWEPVGANWGNYRLVETRNGRLQYLRRYVFELSTTVTDRAETESVIYWALADKKAAEASLLFAECVEPVLRPRTLKFARVTRTEWNIEQITNWIPAINETESLNWPDLKLIKADQRATSLRVPQTGGGYLRRSIANKNLQARIASRWVMEPDRQLLTSRIEFFGTSNTDLLDLELPSGFSVEEVTNRNDKVKVYEREENGVRYAQLIAERTNWENYDFAIRLVKRDMSVETSMPIPWMGVLGAQIMAQTVEVAASKVWRVELVSPSATEKILLGQGEEVGLSALMPGDQIRLIPRSPAAKGSFALSQRSPQADGRLEVVIAGEFDVPIDCMVVAILEIPQLLNNRWRSNVQILPSPCPISGKSWLKIPIDRRSESAETSRFELSFSLTAEEFNTLQIASDWLRLVNPTEVEITGTLSDLLAQLGREVPGGKPSEQLGSGTYVSIESDFGSDQSNLNIIRYWFDTVRQSISAKVAPENVVQSVLWNGKKVVWSRNSDIVTIELPVYPAGQWNEIEIVSNSNSSSNDEERSLAFQIVGGDGPVHAIGASERSDDELQTRLENFSQAVRSILADLKLRVGENVPRRSALAGHSEFWIKRLDQMARQLSPLLTGIDRDKLVELQDEIEAALNGLPVDVELERSEDFLKGPRSNEPKTTPWSSISGSLFIVITVVGVLLFTNSKRFPLVSLAFAGGGVWLLTGLWPIFALILVVVLIVAIDTIWINRSNRRLVR